MFQRVAAVLGIPLTLACCGKLLNPSAPQPELAVVPSVDLDRYFGTWYEIARYPNSFQEGCFATQATYSRQPDGLIRVVNECRHGGLDGKTRRAEAKAWVADPSTRAKLKVQFFWPFRGDYWIIDLGENYEYAVVGHPKRKYLWILSRTPAMDANVYQGILERLRAAGYDPGRLVRTVQPGS